MIDRWGRTLGLAQRANKIVSGEESVLQSIRSKKAKLVIVAEDASGNTLKMMRDKCKYYDVPLLNAGRREELGAFIGKRERVVIGVLDQGFADLIHKKMVEGD